MNDVEEDREVDQFQIHCFGPCSGCPGLTVPAEEGRAEAEDIARIHAEREGCDPEAVVVFPVEDASDD